MLIEAIDQVERAVEVMLFATDRGAAATSVFRRVRLARVDRSVNPDRGAAAASDFRRGLRRSKAIASKLSAFQTAAASCVAATECHGDGGAQILAGTAGLTRSDARGGSSLGTDWGGQHQALSMKFQQLSKRLD